MGASSAPPARKSTTDAVADGRHAKAAAAPRAPAPSYASRTLALSAAGGLGVQRKCACGGTCATCRGDEGDQRIQRKPDDNAAPVLAEPQGLIVEDGEIARAGTMPRATFIAALRRELLPMCDEELAPADRTAQNCPYLTYWLDYAGTLSASRLERGIRRFTGTDADTPQGLIDAVASRVRAAVRIWVATGQIATPKSLGTLGDAGSLGAQVGSLLGGLLGDEAGPPAVQPKALVPGSAPVAAQSPRAVRDQLGAGRALDGSVRARMEQGFGRSFTGVRIHTDTAASQLAHGLAARAFTVGHDVAFRAGEYRPGTLGGDLLIAHELAHTVQQRHAVADGPHAMAQDHRLEDDADRAAVGAVGSLAGLAERMPPSEHTGLRLQGCQEVRKRCPKGYSWRVGTTAGWGSLGCTCFWKCMPGEPPGASAASSGPTVRCPPEMNCSTGVRYEDLGEDYEKKGYGAALTPLGEQAYCGCFPLNFEGEQVSNAPLTATAFELTDVLGPAVDIAAAAKSGARPIVDPTTGQVIPGKANVGPQVTKGSGAPGKSRSSIGALKTKPMVGQYKGEHLPGNPIWGGSTVKYLTDAERTGYKLQFKDGKVYDASGNLFDTRAASSAHSGGGSAIFVMDGAGNFFASKTQLVGEFHHSSLAAGQPVAAAGELRVENGVLKGITDKSGHYRPTTDMTDQAIRVLQSNGVDTTSVSKTIVGGPPPP